MESTTKKAVQILVGMALLIVLLVGIYVGSYFALVQKAPWFYVCATAVHSPEYLGGNRWAHAFFAPIHEFDRKLRPHTWESGPILWRNSASSVIEGDADGDGITDSRPETPAYADPFGPGWFATFR